MPEVAFIHTADLNLRDSSEESVEVLRWLVVKCSERGAALLVAGNLFDSEEQAVRMRAKVMEIFNEAPDLPKFILPGNRDADAFHEDVDYGMSVFPLSSAPFTFVTHEDLKIVGFPYVANSSLRSQLETYLAPGAPLVTLVHGTYFGGGRTAFFEDFRERGEEYFPIYGSDTDDIEANYVAFGGYHSEHVSFVRGDTVLCYPGTPLALGSREIGIRTVALATVNTATGEVGIERLPVPIGTYNIREEIEVLACYENNALQRLERELAERTDRRASLTVRVKGNTRMLVTEVSDRLAELREKFTDQYAQLELRNETTSYCNLIDTRPLARDFIARLALKEDIDEETRARALELGLLALDKVRGRAR